MKRHCIIVWLVPFSWSIFCHSFGIKILNLIFSFPHKVPPLWGNRKHSLTLMYSNRPYSGSQLVINASIVALHPCASYCKHITSDFAQEPALHKHLFRRLAEANESTVHSLIACPGPAVISLKWNIWQPICWVTGFIVWAALLDTWDKLKSNFLVLLPRRPARVAAAILCQLNYHLFFRVCARYLQKLKHAKNTVFQ